MVIAIISVAAAVLALGCLGVLAGGLLRRLNALDRQLTVARKHADTLSDVLAQARHAPS